MAACFVLAAMAAAPRRAGEVIPRRCGVEVKMTDGSTLSVEALSADIFHVGSLPEGAKTPKSQSAVMEPDKNLRVNVIVRLDAVTISTPSTVISLDRNTGYLTFRDATGRLLLSEKSGIDNSGDVKSITFTATPGSGEHFYGAGERGHRPVLNGDSLRMYNRQNYGYTGNDPRISQMGITAPWFVSDAGYGVLVDDYNEALLVMGDAIEYTSKTPQPLSYYFLNGSTLKGVSSLYATLTGHQPLPPLWSLGYITSRYGYRSQAEALGVVDTLKSRGYPLDGLVLDLYWYGKETDMGRLEWNREQFPEPRKMLSELKRKGVSVVAISQPYINKTGALDNYNYLASKGMLTRDSLGNPHDVTTWVGEAGMFDVSNPDTRKWLSDRYRKLTDDGIAGWWGDLGEPEVHPATIRHANGQTASQYHNVYGNEWSRIIADCFAENYPDRRLLLLMRGGTAGLQRYGVFPWTTDVSRSWGGLAPQIKLMLHSGLSGLGYISSDIGGFAEDKAHPTDPELYVRWLEMGVFTPMLRTHASIRPEPYNYPRYESIIKRYIRMRYEWLPYNYTLAYQNAAYGLPLARPLNFGGDNPGAKYAAVDDEYLWGDNVLVAPVMKQGATSRKVLFPAGEWVSWWNPRRRYAGGSTATVAAPLGELPLFVRAGSFIPQCMEPIENTSQYDPRFLTVKYFPAADTTNYTMYDDNRLSPRSLSEGAYRLLEFSGSASGDAVIINYSAAEGGYEGMASTSLLTFEIMAQSAPPASVAINGTPINRVSADKLKKGEAGWNYNAETGVLSVKTGWHFTESTLEITLR